MSRRGITESVIIAPEIVADRQPISKHFANLLFLSQILVDCGIR